MRLFFSSFQHCDYTVLLRGQGRQKLTYITNHHFFFRENFALCHGGGGLGGGVAADALAPSSGIFLPLLTNSCCRNFNVCFNLEFSFSLDKFCCCNLTNFFCIVSYSYWRDFKVCNSVWVCSKRARKLELSTAKSEARCCNSSSREATPERTKSRW